MPLRQAEENFETITEDSLGVAGKASVALQLGQFNRRIDVLVVDGLDVDLTLRLFWYEQNEDFVFDMKNEVLKTGKKCSSPTEVRFRCLARPRFRVRDGMETGRVCVNAAVTTDSCEAESSKPPKWALAFSESAGSGTEMAGCEVAVKRENQTGELGTVDDAAGRVGTEIAESSGQENDWKGMSLGSLREGDLENCEPDDNSMVRFCPTEMGHNVKSFDEHSEENALVIGEVTSGKMVEVGESMRGIPCFLPNLSRPFTSLLSHRNGTRSVFTMVGRERRDLMIAPGGNEKGTKGFFDGSDDDELNFDEDETADGFLSSGENVSVGA